MKEVWYSRNVLIDGADAATLTVNETVTLLNWGNVVVTKVTRYAIIAMVTVTVRSLSLQRSRWWSGICGGQTCSGQH